MERAWAWVLEEGEEEVEEEEEEERARRCLMVSVNPRPLLAIVNARACYSLTCMSVGGRHVQEPIAAVSVDGCCEDGCGSRGEGFGEEIDGGCEV